MSDAIFAAIGVAVLLAIIAALVCGSAVLAAQSAPSSRHTRVTDGTGAAYVERGFQASTGWRPFAAVAVFDALGGAWAATGRATTRSRSRRVLLRVGGGSTATLRLFAACRAGFGAACGTVMGAAAGCAIGLLLVWPMTASVDWEPMPRVAFDTPWSTIIALVLGLPIVAAVIAGLSPATKQTKKTKKI
ncbi:hypothetical protein [Nonomuraea sp. NPDC049158]|uniref:hypothetical protein n=1 Tax=Nonomuraea sp. NPDC049158 TaxID=3155649 RepID=UPI0033D4F939